LDTGLARNVSPDLDWIPSVLPATPRRSHRGSGSRVCGVGPTGRSSPSGSIAGVEGWIELVFPPGPGVGQRFERRAAPGSIGPGPHRLGTTFGGAPAREAFFLAYRADLSGLALALPAVPRLAADGVGWRGGDSSLSVEARGGGSRGCGHTKAGAQCVGVLFPGRGREGV